MTLQDRPAGHFGSVAFLCLARTCGKFLPEFLTFLRELEDQTVDVYAIIGENGSTDDTRTIISSAVVLSGGKYQIHDTSFMRGVKNRFERMAIGREYLKGKLQDSGIEPEFVVVCDIDNVFSKSPDVGTFIQELTQLRSNPDVFAISANSEPYYDIIALRASTIEVDFMKEINRYKRNPITYYLNMRRYVFKFQNSFVPSEHELTSAFNGLCIYRYDQYINSSYIEAAALNECEHVTFNKKLWNIVTSKILISKVFFVQAPEEHIPRGFFKFFMLSFAKRFKFYSIKLRRRS